MANVESFDLDHTKVQAPYVRLAGVKTTPRGDSISKYDLRLLQPNQAEIDPAALHTLEHLLAGYLRDHLSDVVDVSPMGCRTGMYMAVIGEPDDDAKTTLWLHGLSCLCRAKQTPKTEKPRRKERLEAIT